MLEPNPSTKLPVSTVASVEFIFPEKVPTIEWMKIYITLNIVWKSEFIDTYLNTTLTFLRIEVFQDE